MNGMYIKFKSIILILRALHLLHHLAFNQVVGWFGFWLRLTTITAQFTFIWFLVLSHPSTSISQLSSHLLKARGVQNRSKKRDEIRNWSGDVLSRKVLRPRLTEASCFRLSSHYLKVSIVDPSEPCVSMSRGAGTGYNGVTTFFGEVENEGVILNWWLVPWNPSNLQCLLLPPSITILTYSTVNYSYIGILAL